MKTRKLLSLMLVLTMLVSLFSGVSMSAFAADDAPAVTVEEPVADTAEGEEEQAAEEPPLTEEAPAEEPAEEPAAEVPAEVEPPVPEPEAQPEEPVEEEPEADVDDSEPYVFADKIVDRTEYVLAYQDEDTGKFYVVTNKDGALAVSELDNLTVDAVATVENSVWTVEDGAFSSEDYYLNVKDGKVVLDEDESDIWKFDHDDQCPFTEEEDGNYLLAVEDGTLKAYNAEEPDEDADLVALYVVKSVAESETFKNYEEPEPEEPAVEEPAEEEPVEEEPVEEEPAEDEEPVAEETMEEEPADEEYVEEEPAEAEEPAAEETAEEEPAEDTVVAETLGTDGPGFDIVPIDESEEEPAAAVEETEAEEPEVVPAIEPDTPVASSAEESEVLLEKAPEGKAAAKAAAAKAQAAETPVVRAIGQPSGTVLAFTSDTHNKEGNVAANRLGTWLDAMESRYGGVTLMAFGGDMANAGASSASIYWDLTQADINMLETKGVDSYITTGNHEYSPGNYSHNLNDITKTYIENEEAVTGTNFHLYCLGSSAYAESSGGSWWGGGGWNTYSSSQIATLTSYLNSVNDNKPIIIITHYPLHATSSRTISGAGDIIDVLNTAANSGKKIVYLWGHNHTDAPNTETNYDKIFIPGDTITCDSGSKTIQFYYGAAGCMSDSEYGTGSGSVKGKGLIIKINDDNKLYFAYHDANGNTPYTYSEQDPVAIEGATIDEATETGDDGQLISVTPTVETGKTMQLHYTPVPADATVKSITWSSDNTAVATVSNTGKVKGVSPGSATITATISDGITRGTVVASITVEIVARTTSGPTYVLTDTLQPDKNYIIANKNDGEAYALTNNNGSVGLTTVEVEGETIYLDEENESIVFTAGGSGSTVTSIGNNGRYLSASNGSLSLASSAPSNVTFAYGADSKLTAKSSSTYYIYYSTYNGGRYSASTSASSTSSPREVYLFEEVTEQIAVESVTVAPTESTIEARKTVQLTATVSPANATNKAVTWTSSDTSIATVDENGKVRGVAKGTAVITATTVDGGKTATATINVTPSTSTEQHYVIVIDGYALSVNRSPNTAQGGSSSYTYTGLAGVAFTAGTAADDSIRWIIEETDGGYYIKDLNGNYLNATYTSGDSSGQGDLKLDDTPDVWVLDSGYSLDDGTVDGSKLKSTNASETATSDKFLGYEENPANLFTVRSSSNADEVTIMDAEEGSDNPPTPTEGTNYKLVDQFTSGKEYLIVSANTAGSAYALTNPGGTSSGANMGRTAVTIQNGDIDGDGTADLYITNEATDIVWTATANSSGFNLTNGSDYLEGKSGNVKIFNPQQYADRYWTYNNNYLLHEGGSYTYEVYYSNSNFTSRQYNSGNPTNKVYIYEKTEPVQGDDPVESVSLNKSETTLTVGATETLVATVLPATAGDKSVTWTTSDDTVATVDQTGKVTAVKEGTATITVTTTNGGKTASASITVKPNDNPQTGYIITIGNYAMSTDPSDDQLENTGSSSSQKYIYTGLAAVEYDGSDAPDNIWWNIVETDGGVYIMSPDGRYLNSTYESNSTGGNNGTLKLDNTQDVWVLEGTIEDWMIDGSKLKSTNSTKFLAEETGKGGKHFFTIRSENNADETTLVDPSATIEERYIETDTFEDGKEYIIAVTKDDSSVYAVKNITGTSTGNTGSVMLTVTPASGSDSAYIETDEDGVVWKYASSNQYLSTSNSHYLGYESSTYLPRVSSQGRAIIYSDGKLQITSGRYLTCADDGTFATATSFSSGANVRLFVKTLEVISCEHTYGDPEWTWTGSDNEGYTAATAKFTCSKCGDTQIVTATVTSETTAEETVYTATATFNGVTYTDTKTVEAPVVTYTFVSFTWTGNDTDGYTAAVANYTGSDGSEETVGATITTATTDATCTVTGSTVYTATVTAANSLDSAEHTDSKTVTIPATGHTITAHEAVAATCTGAGNSAYWSCDKCGKYFSDAEGTTEIEENSWVISALGHNWGEWTQTTAPTCTKAGVETRSCSRCHESETRDVAALGHDLVHHDAKEATCTAIGWNAYDTCSRCDYTTYEEIPATGHTLIVHAAVAATCTTAGSSAYWSCDKCRKYFSDAEGTTEIEENSWVISALDHDWDEVNYEWAEDNSSVTATRTCKNDASHVETETVNTTAVVTKQPTCESKGETTYSATFENDAFAAQTRTVVDIDATGHDWGDVIYTWAEDNSTVTATRICKNDAAHVETESVSATYEVTKPATETEAGEGTWTSEQFQNPAFEVQTTTVDIPPYGYKVTYDWAEADDGWTATGTAVPYDTSAETVTETVTATPEVTTEPTCETPGVKTWTATFTKDQFSTQTWTEYIPATGHKWSEPTYSWSADNKSVTATRVCENNENHVETETVNTTAVVTKQPTCEAKGETAYTATFANTAFATQTKTVDDISAIGHDWGEWVVTTKPTCTEAGEETRTCSRCDETETRPVTALEHDLVHHDAQAATCTEIGWDAYDTCSRCDYTTYVEILATGHTEVVDAAVAPTCTETGLTEGKHCSACGAVLTAQKEIAALGHDYKEDAGSAKAATCTEAGKYADKKCSRCGDVITGATIAATGHKWGTPTWSWSNDHITATAQFTCQNDKTHIRSVKATVTGPVSNVYTATVTGPDGKTYTSRKICPSKAFKDLDTTRWYHAATDYVIENEIMIGTTADTFAPNDIVTRGQIVTILYRMAGEPAVSGNSGFSDVSSGRFYSKAVKWGVDNGIVKGYDAKTFGPEDPVTREQLATFLQRYATYMNLDDKPTGSLSGYTDAGQVGKYATDPMKWAVGHGIITGTTATTLSPKANATRAEIATMVYRFKTKIG